MRRGGVRCARRLRQFAHSAVAVRPASAPARVSESRRVVAARTPPVDIAIDEERRALAWLLRHVPEPAARPCWPGREFVDGSQFSSAAIGKSDQGRSPPDRPVGWSVAARQSGSAACQRSSVLRPGRTRRRPARASYLAVLSRAEERRSAPIAAGHGRSGTPGSRRHPPLQFPAPQPAAWEGGNIAAPLAGAPPAPVRSPAAGAPAYGAPACVVRPGCRLRHFPLSCVRAAPARPHRPSGTWPRPVRS